VLGASNSSGGGPKLFVPRSKVDRNSSPANDQLVSKKTKILWRDSQLSSQVKGVSEGRQKGRRSCNFLAKGGGPERGSYIRRTIR